MKTWTSILAAGAILAFAAPVGSAALGTYPDGVSSSRSIAPNAANQLMNGSHVKRGKHAKHTARVGYGPYAYLGNTAPVAPSATRIGP
jgi:hypothetical protein